MGLKKLAEKLADYKERLDLGQTQEIKPNHVEKVLKKLRSKVTELEADISEEDDPDKKERLIRKLSVANEQVARAEWLFNEIHTEPEPAPSS